MTISPNELRPAPLPAVDQREGGTPPFVPDTDGILARLLGQRTPLDALLDPEGGSHAHVDTADEVPVQATTPDAPSVAREHAIVWGDTLSELAVRYGTTVDALVQANGIADPDRVYAGDTLIIPGGASGGGGGGTQMVAGITASDTTVEASDAQVRAVLDAMPADVRAANPNVAEDVSRILSESRAQNLTPEQTAYVLASATHESGMGAYMEEFASGAAYEGRGDLGNTEPGDGVRFKGRGYVQITGRTNYAEWSERLGVDLVGNPGLAEDPDIAVQILVGGMKDGTFTGVGVGDFINEGRADYVGARAVVNGSDRASLIAGYAEGYAAALQSVPASREGGPGPASSITLAYVGTEFNDAPIRTWDGSRVPVNLDGAGAEIEAMLGPIVDAYRAAGDPDAPIITSANDQVHSANSRHYSNQALDLSTQHLSAAQATAIASDLQARLGPDYYVELEALGTSNEHIHVEYDV